MGLLDKAADFLDDGKFNDSTNAEKTMDAITKKVEEVKEDIQDAGRDIKKSGRIPEWMYECLGTMFFTMMVCSAWGDDAGLFNSSFAVGMSFALCHCVFVSHCAAYFNPLMVAARVVTGDYDMAHALKLIFGQYVGCAFGLGLLGKLSGTALEAADAGGKKELIMLVILAALLMKFFWTPNSDSTSGVPDAIWYALAIAVVHMIGGSAEDSHMTNPAVYTGNGVNKVIGSIFGDGEFDAFGFFGATLAQNVALYAGAMIAMLVAKN